MVDITFHLDHNDAYAQFGAIRPGTQWCAFNVRKDRAEKEAKEFFLTLWNNRILIDKAAGAYWYNVTLRKRAGEGGTQRTALWSGLQTASRLGLPITGILKDRVSNKCASLPYFSVVDVQFRGEDGWLKLVPSKSGILNLGVSEFDAEEVVGLKPSIESLEASLRRRVAAALEDSVEARRARLKQASRTPAKVEVKAYVFDRNADVIAEVLYLAKGRCQRCGNAAPFPRKTDRSPYLEVHHKIRLADDGDDTVANAEALCPNCHRFKHYGYEER